MTEKQQLGLMVVIAVGCTVVFTVLAIVLFKSADENRDKDVHMMQVCTEAGGTWLGEAGTCVQPRSGT